MRSQDPEQNCNRIWITCWGPEVFSVLFISVHDYLSYQDTVSCFYLYVINILNYFFQIIIYWKLQTNYVFGCLLLKCFVWFSIFIISCLKKNKKIGQIETACFWIAHLYNYIFSWTFHCLLCILYKRRLAFLKTAQNCQA